VEVLGMGGMGAVYKGFQTSLERYVAIKIMPPSFSDDDLQYAQRFKQEAKTMARLSHPGIVGVHDCGETAQGWLYIVMEFIEGTDVHRMIQAQGHLPGDQAMAIIMHVCDALSYAHSNGIIHRDIKPANIMVDNLGRVKVADFGLAKVATVNSGLSSSNLTMGTPDYVAPEALIVNVEVDARADVYSVGVTLYEMLTGKVPRGRFEAASVRVPGLDPRFDKVIDRAMRDNRDARYPTAQALRDDLMQIHMVPLSQSGMRQAAARARGPSEPPRHPVHDNVPEEEVPSGPPLALIGVAVAVVVGLALFFWKPWAAKESSGKASVAQTEKSSSVDTSNEPPPASPTPAPPTTPPAVAEASSQKSTAAPGEPPKESRPAASPPSPTPAPPQAPVVAAPAQSSSPTPPPPAPARALVPVPKSELDMRVATLDQLFHAAAERETEPLFKANVATLDKGYLGALDRAMAASTQGGKLDESLALRAEKQRMEKEMIVPAADDSATPEVLKDLRKTYRATYDKLEADHLKSLQPLYDKYDQALNGLQVELTKADKLDDAVRVKSLRDRLSRLRTTGATSLLDESGNSVVRDDSVVIYPNTPMGYKIGPVKIGDQITLSYVGGTWKDHGRLATESPDRPSSDGGPNNRLVIAHAPAGNGPGSLVALVPTGTKANPFTFAVSSAAEDLVLRINANSDDKGNPGKVTYRLKITRVGGGSPLPGPSAPAAADVPAAPISAPPPGTSRLSLPGLGFTNSLGMKFVSVPGTSVLMCIHETRKKDYATYAAENPGVNTFWKNPRDHNIAVSPRDDHPVVAVDWDDAKGFCAWLSKRENRTYRLPTDHEWSVAAGIGDKEDPTATPESLNSKVKDMYPWGSAWPPPNGVANLADTSFKSKFSPEPAIAGYTDGYVTTSPVMSFAPNNLGIYDLAGNVWEWCEDFYDEKKAGHVLRGGSWFVAEQARLLTSFRSRNGPGIRYSHGGFRVVVVAP
jgi:serine/threonine protein kinase